LTVRCGGIVDASTNQDLVGDVPAQIGDVLSHDLADHGSEEEEEVKDVHGCA